MYFCVMACVLFLLSTYVRMLFFFFCLFKQTRLVLFLCTVRLKKKVFKCVFLICTQRALSLHYITLLVVCTE